MYIQNIAAIVALNKLTNTTLSISHFDGCFFRTGWFMAISSCFMEHALRDNLKF
jgi:hypothetical protein